MGVGVFDHRLEDECSELCSWVCPWTVPLIAFFKLEVLRKRFMIPKRLHMTLHMFNSAVGQLSFKWATINWTTTLCLSQWLPRGGFSPCIIFIGSLCSNSLIWIISMSSTFCIVHSTLAYAHFPLIFHRHSSCTSNSSLVPEDLASIEGEFISKGNRSVGWKMLIHVNLN